MKSKKFGYEKSGNIKMREEGEKIKIKASECYWDLTASN